MVRSGRFAGLAMGLLAALVVSSAAPALPTAVPAPPLVPRTRSATPPHRAAAIPPARTGGADADGARGPGAMGGGMVEAGLARWLPRPRFTPESRVGAVFGPSATARHYCTGSVVDSPRRDLVITAAHCVHDGAGGGYRTGLAFSPGLRRDGTEPAGRWRVRAALAEPDWVTSSDPTADVAFLVVEALHGEDVEDAVGGNPIAFDAPSGGPVRLIGYPRRQDAPVVCDGEARSGGVGRLRVYCPGFSGGTSGSPWLAGPPGVPRPTGTGTVIGVIGGYEGGGWTPDVSYSSPFDARVRALYEAALRLR